MRLYSLILMYNIIALFQFSCSGNSNQAKGRYQNPLLARNTNLVKDEVYDTRQWELFAGSPIRATPLITSDRVFVGTAAGKMMSIDKKSGKLDWAFETGHAIHSSAASQDGRLFFADNEQAVYALDAQTGEQIWKFRIEKKKNYPWRFDYYYSGPFLDKDRLFIGADDGNVYALRQHDGSVIWSFNTGSLVRATPVLLGSTLLLGDVDGRFYAIDAETGKEKWRFNTTGESAQNDSFGFDRKAILASAAFKDGRIVFGGRDGFLYCIDTSGSLAWKVNHQFSWIVSTVAIKDSFVVTGTSDGKFVQAVNLYSGKELWKYQPNTLFWSSPLISGEYVYAGGYDGQLYCLDLKTGQRISQFQTGGIILSSPVIDGGQLFVGSDDGNLYSLKGHPSKALDISQARRYVYYEPGMNVYFQGNADIVIRNYLQAAGYKAVDADGLARVMDNGSDSAVVVFATDYFPPSLLEGGRQSLLRRFLDSGGRIVLPGMNPLLYKIDPKLKRPVAFADTSYDKVLDIDYGPHDTRAFGGQFPSFATGPGKSFGLPDYWVSAVFIDTAKVDVVLGKNENGLASAFIKKYRNNGALVQVFVDPSMPFHLDAILKLSEWKLE